MRASAFRIAVFTAFLDAELPGRFGMYVPPLLEHLGLIELEHNPRNNRARAR